MSLWRKRVVEDWELKYGVRVAGFETFVVENERRKGALYKADNWTFVGETQGNTKMHLHGIDKSFVRTSTGKKLVFCKRIRNRSLPKVYIPTWNNPGQCKGQMTIGDFL